MSTADLDEPSKSTRCQRFMAWLQQKGIKVVVFDMDCTMSSGHCGEGLLRGQAADEYIAAASRDFVEAALAVHAAEGLHLAVATGSDPAEYDLPGQSRETHILGPDLARALMEHWCPDALATCGIMVGFDCRLHGDKAEDRGKRHHMRAIQEHYQVPFRSMLLLDDARSNLQNEDGWYAVLVQDRIGFRFEDCLELPSSAPSTLTAPAEQAVATTAAEGAKLPVAETGAIGAPGA